MSEEDISRLAGETEETSVERKRLEEKHGILKKGLQNLKGFLKRRNVVSSSTQDQVASGDSEKMPPMTPGRSEKASIATNSTYEGPRLIVPYEARHSAENEASVSSPTSGWELLYKSKQWQQRQGASTQFSASIPLKDLPASGREA